LAVLAISDSFQVAGFNDGRCVSSGSDSEFEVSDSEGTSCVVSGSG